MQLLADKGKTAARPVGVQTVFREVTDVIGFLSFLGLASIFLL